jgi:hypothetical protein
MPIIKVLQAQMVKTQYFPLAYILSQKKKTYEKGLDTVASHHSTLFRRLLPLRFVKISVYSRRVLRVSDLRLASPYSSNLPIIMASAVRPNITRQRVAVQGIFAVQHFLIFITSQVQDEYKKTYVSS